VWADALQRAEQLHFLRMCFWGGVSTVAGTALLVLILSHSRNTAIITRFAVVCVVIGVAEMLLGAAAYHAVPLRDLAAATRLDREAWLQLGLYIGLTAVGATLVTLCVAERATLACDRALPWIGAGMATLIHGVALTVLELLLISQISR
jgi:hypothetical protein